MRSIWRATAMMKYLDLCHLSSVLLPGWSTGHPVNVEKNTCNIHCNCCNAQNNSCHTNQTILALAQHSTQCFIIKNSEIVKCQFWFFLYSRWKSFIIIERLFKAFNSSKLKFFFFTSSLFWPSLRMNSRTMDGLNSTM